VSCGGKHALYNIAQVLFEAGDEVIIPSPYWVSYPDQVIINDAKPVIVETQEKNGFKITAAELEKAITPQTKAFILNSPSNPTGAAYSRQELEALAEVLVRKNVLCISDEIYEKIVYDGFQFVSIASLNEEIKKRTITVNGASKVYSMTGWRMGYAAGPKEIIAAMTKLQGQVTTNINSMTQWASIAALNGSQEFLKDWVGEFKKRRDYILERFSKIAGVTCYKPEGAFYVFPNISTYIGKKADGKVLNSDDEIANYLLDKHLVAVVAGSGFGAPGFIRLSYATSMENIQKGLDRIEKGLKELQ
ncbi:MAG: pyridoxal phosphate-dependent aminotransferase, partial [Deltaproteobacteria bacterium]|nr:pyridoxal phosphate-dependent aminotransferase [Deltaproteobacteria bacterium]